MTEKKHQEKLPVLILFKKEKASGFLWLLNKRVWQDKIINYN